MSMYFINDIENEMQKGKNNNQIMQTINLVDSYDNPSSSWDDIHIASIFIERNPSYVNSKF